MKNKKAVGNAAEEAAAGWIEKNKGFVILERNYAARGGEIDIIALDRDTTVFVEVKYRGSDVSGYPSEAVTEKKQERIIKTAMKYISETGNDNIRFDVAEIMDRNGKKYIRYIETAFEWRSFRWN